MAEAGRTVRPRVATFTLRSINPAYDMMDLKSIEDWTIEKPFKSVPDVVGVTGLVSAWRKQR
jgi:Cu/Ag efflux pump CusA